MPIARDRSPARDSEVAGTALSRTIRPRLSDTGRVERPLRMAQRLCGDPVLPGTGAMGSGSRCSGTTYSAEPLLAVRLSAVEGAQTALLRHRPARTARHAVVRLRPAPWA
ncbi:hypothetical protein GCM10011380_07860 [Sphingomonas metalli]|uniref:Uncharacterized protein n=1 Tax=Sphingomonas metalli TaxID=1779358 RepID=A0A916SZG3_9SPHN|nr:hypothetical protein GCM10011380_07860 [Sphingomonas metalli]